MTARSTIAGAVALAFAALQGSAFAETLALKNRLTVTLPEGWQIDEPRDGWSSKDGLWRIRAVCETEACRETQEVCTFLLRPSGDSGGTDAARFTALYDTPLKRYARLRAVLANTSRDAELLQPLGVTRFGTRDWHAVETDARHNRKSGLFAETVVDGWYVGAICKSCETGPSRHASGRAILGSLIPGP